MVQYMLEQDGNGWAVVKLLNGFPAQGSGRIAHFKTREEARAFISSRK